MANASPYLATPTQSETQQSLRHNVNEWRGALNEEAYFRRETFLSDQGLARNGGLRGWILAQDNQDGTRSQLAACESLRKRALVAFASSGEVKEVNCHGVASVFCPPENRGKGYPSTMIEQLGQQLDGEEDTAFSVLYSDIGKQFYAKRGWKAMDSGHVHLPPVSGQVREGVELLKDEDLHQLLQRDEAVIRRRLEQLAGKGKNAIAILPNKDAFEWQHAREAFVSKELLGRTPDVQGAKVKTASGKDVWCLWTRWWYNSNIKESKGNTLHILRLAVEDEDYDDTPATSEGVQQAAGSEITKAIASLLAAAQVEASKWNMAEVEIWNPSSATLAAAQKLDPKAQVIHRDLESIASLRWCDKKLAGISEDDITWTCNEKFAWC